MTEFSILTSEQATRIHALLMQAHKIVVTCHVSPDGDAIGSSLAMAQILRALGKTVYVVTPDMPPKALSFLPGARHIIAASRFQEKSHGLLKSADLIFCMDFNAYSRVDRMSEILAGTTAPKIMVDHHIGPEDWAEVTVSRPDMSSTCLLLYHMLVRLGFDNKLDRSGAECLYTGMMTDTGNFTYNSNDSDLYIVISRLLQHGIDKNDIYQKVFNTHSASALRICGYALYRKMQLLPDHHAALITLTRQELKDFSYDKGDTEGLVNVPLSIPGIEYSVYMRQDEENYVKISTRSKGDFPVNLICKRHFGGGGHLNAAGGEFHGTLEEAVSAFLAIIPEYDRYLAGANNSLVMPERQTDCGESPKNM